MKGFYLSCLILVCLGGDLAQAAEPRKHALLVGISTYRNLPSLPGATHDVANMKDLLVKTMGFQARMVITLENEAATRAAILSQLEDLIKRVGAQDTVVFHFSGHGSQRKDASHDEEDGLDETLVPFDSRDPGIYDISDDEINQLLARLNARCSNLTFIFDSCHSGTGQRTGTLRKVDPDLRKRDTDASARVKPSTRQLGKVQADNYVMVAACTSTQVAGEIEVDGLQQGALTHYLAKALRQAEGKTTWNQVIDDVRRGVQRHFRGQTPLIHGKGERVIFGMHEFPTEPHILVSPGKGKALTLAAGRVHGLTEGSVFELFAARNGVKKHRLGKAKLTEVGPFSSRAQQLDGGPVSEGDWALESEHAYASKQLLLHFRKPVPKGLLEEIKKLASFVTVNDPAEAQLVIEHTPRPDRIILKDRDGIAMGAALDATDVKAASRKILEWGRWFNVLSISSQGPATPKLAYRIAKRGDRTSANPAQHEATEAVFREGDKLVFKADNLSKQKVFLTLLVLSSSGEIVQLFPTRGEDQPISPGGSVELLLDATLSKGYEVEKTIIKLFATLQRIDLSFLEQPGATRRGDNPHPLEALAGLGVRGGNMQPPRWTALDQVLVIKKAGVD